MGKYLENEDIQNAIEMYLATVPNGDQLRAQPDYIAQLSSETRQIAAQVEDLLARFQALAEHDEAELALLYGLLKRLPVLSFEPINYTFVGRVVIPLENVIDLLIHLDVYSSGQPVRKGETPGVVELVSLAEESKAQATPTEERVIDVAGIGPVYARLLRDRADIHTTQDLLEKGSTSEGRAGLERQTGLSKKLLTKWVRRADLMRIDGVGEEYGELLESAGVESGADLARRSPDRLRQQIEATNIARRLVHRVPSLEEIKGWIAQAGTLP